MSLDTLQMYKSYRLFDIEEHRVLLGKFQRCRTTTLLMFRRDVETAMEWMMEIYDGQSVLSRPF